MYLTPGNFSHIDLSLATPQLAAEVTWYTYSDGLGSDHLPIILKLGQVDTAGEAYLPLCKFRVKNVNWAPYTDLATISPDGDNVDVIYRSITGSILSAADQSLPKVSPLRRRVLVPWWTPECREAIRVRNNAYRAFQHSPTDDRFIDYKKARAAARRVIREAKRKSWRDFVSTINRDTPTAEIWNAIKRINGKSCSRPLYLRVGGILIDDPEVIAEELAKYFASVSADTNFPDVFLEGRAEREVDIDFSDGAVHAYNAPFSMSEFLYVLGKVRGSSAGPDGIRYEMVQHLSLQDKSRLLDFFNLIWESQDFPTDWCEAVTIPILKPGKDSREASSYRPIALTNVLCKIMERLVNRRLSTYLEVNNVLHPMQSGFRKGRNTYTNLLALEHDVKGSLCYNDFTAAVFLNIEKAFDMCSRWGILNKLHGVGLRGNLPVFIQNFIKMRVFSVKVGNVLSEAFCQANGVPQGSVLSPTLFLLAINDLLPQPPQGVKKNFLCR